MDIISQLSDDLLLRILSCLPTKDVVTTSLLSRRWRSLWMLTPKLDYDDTNHIGDYKIFLQYVYMSLMSNKAPALEKLRLNLGGDCSAVDIRPWIDFAVTRRVRELDIKIRSNKEGYVSMPSSLYNSDTLETLTLTGLVLLNAPVSVCLPSLKNLNLIVIGYFDNATLPKVLSGCPKLEELILGRDDETENVIVVVPSLQKLVLFGISGGKCKGYVIDAPGLKELHIIDNVEYNFRRIENMPELAEAYVDFTQKVPQKFLKALTSAQYLSLGLSLSEVTHPSGMIFNRLVHLNLSTIREGWWDLLTLMLQDSPKLKTLKLINNSSDSGIETLNGWKPASFVPECLLSSLEAFEWIGYRGRQGDKMVAAYVLRNAFCLKTARFDPETTDVVKKYEMLKELASVATASTSCQILFDLNGNNIF